MSESSTTVASDLAQILKTVPKISQKLKNEYDYPAWVVEATRQLRQQKLLDIVNGTTPKPTDATALVSWEEKSDEALEYLMDSCELEPQLRIRASAGAAEAWKVLRDTYQVQAQACLTSLYLKVIHLRDDDGKDWSLTDHIRMFESLWLNLVQLVNSTGNEEGSMVTAIKPFILSDSWKTIMLLTSLPRVPPYINIVDNIIHEEDKPPYANVVYRLKEIPARNKTRNRKPPTEPQTAISTTRPRTRTPCGYCRSMGHPGTGHEESECRTKKRDANRRQQESPNATEFTGAASHECDELLF